MFQIFFFCITDKTVLKIIQDFIFIQVLSYKDQFIDAVAPIFVPPAFNKILVFYKGCILYPMAHRHTSPPHSGFFQTERTACLGEIQRIIRS